MKDLKVTSTQSTPNFPEAEENVIQYWDDHQIFKKSIDARPADRHYVFYDGPPFATGMPHYGHIVASTTKDVMPRYWTMKGYRVDRKWGWDCHGLPIENIIEKELNLKDKQAIEEYGVENFNNACRMAVLRYADEWKKFIHRLGRWVNMDNDYKTMEPWYMESLWWVFKMLWERNLIYHGHKSMHICPRCSTPLSNFEVTQGYKDVKDISVYVGLKLKSLPPSLVIDQPVYAVAWTTTPWTIPGNLLLAIKPDTTYVAFSQADNPHVYIAAKERMGEFADLNLCHILAEFAGTELINLSYEPAFPYHQDTPNAFRIVAADFVTTTEGTGIVSIAPAFGQDDYNLGKREQVPFVQNVGMDGRYTAEVTDFAGRMVKPKDNPLETDIEIIKYLNAHHTLVKKQNIVHSYPHCWRCDTPLINYATSSWFVKVTHFKEQLLQNNQHINWVPDHIKNGRFGKWLENAIDWAISRNRYWGTPLPIWQSDDGDTICVGSIAELEQLSHVTVKDLHKQIIDQIEITQNGKTYKRIPEVLDCWFESGAMPYASFHYPFANKDHFEENFPAEFISEGQDQTRGWFYTLHVLATALTLGDQPAIDVGHSTSAFKNVIVNGIVLAEDGKKMSKRLQNYPDPMVIANKYGFDALRLYLMSSPVMRAENLNFSEKGVDEIKKKVINISWNVFSFLKLYDSEDVPVVFPQTLSEPLNQWLKSRTGMTTHTVMTAMDQYDVVTASRELIAYIDDLSTWFLRLSRERIKNGDREALQTLKAGIYRFILLLAPFAPFVTELIYQNLAPAKESIHLEMYADLQPLEVNQDIISTMNEVKNIVTDGHAARKSSGISLKQPLAGMMVSGYPAVSKELAALILQELNLKKIGWQTQGQEKSVTLDISLTPELIEEGKARQLIRDIQAARKAAGTTIEEIVTVELPDWPEAFESEIMAKVKANRLIRADSLRIIRPDQT